MVSVVVGKFGRVGGGWVCPDRRRQEGRCIERVGGGAVVGLEGRRDGRWDGRRDWRRKGGRDGGLDGWMDAGSGREEEI